MLISKIILARFFAIVDAKFDSHYVKKSDNFGG